MGKGEEFLKYIEENYKRLRKKVTKKHPINEDLFNDTIVNIYNILEKNNTIINNFDYYFCRSYYIALLQELTKNKKITKVEISKNLKNSLEDSDKNKEEHYRELDKLFYKIKEYVMNNYSCQDFEIWKMKVCLKYTYDKISKITNIKYNSLQKKVVKINEDIQKNFKINYENIK